MKPLVSIIPEPETIALDPQRCFNPNQRVAIFTRAKGRCEVCDTKVKGKWYAGHIIPHALGGRTEIDNGRVEGVECGCAKDTHREDTTTAAKTERMALRKGQQKRRKDRGGSCIPGPTKEQRQAQYQRAKAAQRAMKERVNEQN